MTAAYFGRWTVSLVLDENALGDVELLGLLRTTKSKKIYLGCARPPALFSAATSAAPRTAAVPRHRPTTHALSRSRR